MPKQPLSKRKILVDKEALEELIIAAQCTIDELKPEDGFPEIYSDPEYRAHALHMFEYLHSAVDTLVKQLDASTKSQEN